ncbi:MAG: UvrB/UvrC motif-containing protein [Elusimicrobia bacterium]|nr:UvrB/UvrC motif-containing protein [Elusimicrobiota bacterium]
MLCARCKKKPAQFLIKNIVDNQVSEAHLCLDCAHGAAQESVAPALAGLLSLLGGAAPAPREKAPAKCASCGLRWTDFRKTGFLGCPACYDCFAVPLKGVLQEMQGAVRHSGKRPARSSADLRGRLDAALKSENYEEAARLRDLIRKGRAA